MKIESLYGKEYVVIYKDKEGVWRVSIHYNKKSKKELMSILFGSIIQEVKEK